MKKIATHILAVLLVVLIAPAVGAQQEEQSPGQEDEFGEPEPQPILGVPEDVPEDKLVLWKGKKESSFLTFGGYLQIRYEYTNNDSNMQKATTIDKFVLNKTRLTFKAHLASWANAKIEFDLYDPHTSSPVLPVEIYGAFPIFPYLELRGGIMKAPLMYQRMMPGRNHAFAEPAMVTDQKVLKKSGMDAQFKMASFPSSDVGIMISGDLFPWPHMPRLRKLPKGILRYYLAYQNGYNPFRGTGKSDSTMLTFRIETNPFGYRAYDESNAHFEPYIMVAFNYGQSVDNNSNYDIVKDTEVLGVDGIIAWQGVAISGAWYRMLSAGSKAYERQDVFDPAFKTEGFFVQVTGFIPGWKLRQHLQLKFRYQRFDPFEMVPGHLYTDAQEIEFRPQQLTSPQDRMTEVITFGANVFFSFPGLPNRVMLSFDYNLRTEVEKMWIADAWDDTQIRNNSWMVQLQFAL